MGSKYIKNSDDSELKFSSLACGDYFVDAEEGRGSVGDNIFVVTDEKSETGLTWVCVVAQEGGCHDVGTLVSFTPDNKVRRLELVTEPQWKLV